MYKYSFDEVAVAISQAKNMNAALKKIIKNEPNMPQKSSRFLKDWRAACGAKDPEKKLQYIKERMPEHEAEVFAVARYAYLEPLNEIADEITTEYADKFNSTYVQDSGSVEVKDRKTFDKIVSEVLVKIEDGLKKRSLQANGFMKNVLLKHIFDAEVLREITV